MTRKPIAVHGVDEVQRYLRRLPNRVAESAREAVADTTFKTHETITRRLQGDPLKSRTGRLRRSFQTDVSKPGTKIHEIYGRVSTDVKYAPVHEKGATIRAKRAYTGLPGGPYLNIPAEGNHTPAGVQRWSARTVFNRGGHIRPLKSAPSADYVVMLRDEPMFWLVKEVTIPARLGAREAAEDQVPTLLSNLDRLLQDDLNE